MTSRSAHVSNGQNELAIISHSLIAKAHLIIRSAPCDGRGDTLEAQLDPSANVADCQAAPTAAVLACRLPLAAPSVDVVCTDLRGDGTAC